MCFFYHCKLLETSQLTPILQKLFVDFLVLFWKLYTRTVGPAMRIFNTSGPTLSAYWCRVWRKDSVRCQGVRSCTPCWLCLMHSAQRSEDVHNRNQVNYVMTFPRAGTLRWKSSRVPARWKWTFTSTAWMCSPWPGSLFLPVLADDGTGGCEPSPGWYGCVGKINENV